jgi:hypothetical protein
MIRVVAMWREALARHRRDAVVAIALGALSLVFVSPVFRHLENLGVLDWDANLFMLEVPRITILQYRQAPLWNPYEWGGIPMLGSPWSRWLSPSFLLVLGFGTVAGAKIDIWLHLSVGLWGTFLLAREHGMRHASAFLAACAYLFGGWFALVVASGMSVFLGAALIPWAVLLHRRARLGMRYHIALGGVCALMLFDGAVEPLVIVLLALALRTAADLATRRTSLRGTAALLSVSGAVFVGLSAIKLLPMVELLWKRPRLPRQVGGYSVESLSRALLERGQSLGTEFPAGDGFWRGMSWGIDETGAYVGVVVVGLAGLGVLARGRRHPVLIASLVCFVWLAFGERAPVGPWQLLEHVPPFSMMRVPERFRFVFLLDLALLAGLGLDALTDAVARSPRGPRWLSGRAATAAGVVAAAIAFDLVSANSPALRDAFSIPPVALPSRGSFVQIQRLPRYDERGFLRAEQRASVLAPSSSLYPAVRAGMGSPRGFEPLTARSRPRVHALGEPRYRGEQWLSGTLGTVKLVRWTPNTLTFDVHAESPGRLVINQIFDRGWRSGGARPVSEGALLAVPVSPGERRVELRYLPASFLAGAISTAASLLVFGGWAWRRRHRTLQPARS